MSKVIEVLPAARAHEIIGKQLIGMSAARLRAWKNYRRLTVTKSHDLVTGETYDMPSGPMIVAAVQTLKDGTVSVKLSREGVRTPNSVLCAPDSTITVYGTVEET